MEWLVLRYTWFGLRNTFLKVSLTLLSCSVTASYAFIDVISPTTLDDSLSTEEMEFGREELLYNGHFYYIRKQ